MKGHAFWCISKWKSKSQQHKDTTKQTGQVCLPKKKAIKKPPHKHTQSERTEWIGIVSCFVKPHPSSTRCRKHFIPVRFVFCPGLLMDEGPGETHTHISTHTCSFHPPHHVVTKDLADWADLLHLLACCCQTLSFSKDNAVTSTLPLQNKPTLMKDCGVSVRKIQIKIPVTLAGVCTR